MVITVTILGSGGTIPTLTRNLPATAIQCDGKLFLFDCGEGTQTQIVRAKLSIGKLEGIFISHLHGDHVMGLPGLLMTLSQVPREKPLILCGPKGLREFIECNRRFLGFQHSFDLDVIETTGGTVFDDDELGIDCSPADHSCFTLAYGLRENERPGRFLTEEAKRLGVQPGPLFGQLQAGESVMLDDGREVHSDDVLGPPRRGRKIVYATDTRPCDEVALLAHHADVLVHDGMFDDDLRDQAKLKKHSTVVQAARLAKRAQVKRLILTHVSNRYLDDRPLLLQARSVFPNTKMARDLMEIDVPMYK
ncbi:MAG: ribonuclease Z [Candidatus Latescibacteria bacterium]|nr:ribonuclease Z [Candidatus Latescibacterota bacterium]